MDSSKTEKIFRDKVDAIEQEIITTVNVTKPGESLSYENIIQTFIIIKKYLPTIESLKELNKEDAVVNFNLMQYLKERIRTFIDSANSMYNVSGEEFMKDTVKYEKDGTITRSTVLNPKNIIEKRLEVVKAVRLAKGIPAKS
jgi:hypothetical protein